MNIVGSIGKAVIVQWKRVRHLLALVATVLQLALSPRCWTRPVRNVLARQILFTGVEAVRFIGLIALLAGISIVVQFDLWLSKFGQSALLGPLLVTVVVREVGPILTNFVVIGRSGAAIAAEMANMRVVGDIHVLDAQGIDPLIYLVMPRVLGVALSVFCLTILFIFFCFFSGYVSGLLLGANTGPPSLFVNSVLGAIRPADVVNLLAKTLIPGLLTGAICCEEGLRIAGAMTEVPQATTRGQVKSVAALFITSALISLVTYL